MIVNEQEDYELGFEEYVNGAVREESAKSFRCAVDLYYKAVCQLIDYLLFKEGIDVNKLKDRWDQIKALNMGVFQVFELVHGIYRSAYKNKKDKRDCQELRNGIKKIVFLKGIEGRFKEAVEKI